jgi:hypothetical protein
MKDATALLGELRRCGLSIRAQDSRLVVSPASQLPSKLQSAIAAHKTAILALLTTALPCPDCGGWCVKTSWVESRDGRAFWCADRRCGRIVWQPDGESPSSSVAEVG